jgi:hypothetical protein
MDSRRQSITLAARKLLIHAAIFLIRQRFLRERTNPASVSPILSGLSS